MATLLRRLRPQNALKHINRAHHLLPRTASSFAELYHQSVESAPIAPGDILQGHIVGALRPRSSTARFYVIDFGLKSEAPFTAKEIPGQSQVGDVVTMPIMAIEDDFNEPVFDHDGRTSLPALQAERYRLLTSATTHSAARLLHGRFSKFNRGGAIVKVLGSDAFSPRHHVVSLQRPVLGNYAPFLLLSLRAERASSTNSSLDINPIVSSYGGFLFLLSELVGSDEAWRRSGGGSARERLAYLRLLTRLLQHKNIAVRRLLPRGAPMSDRKGSDSRRRSMQQRPSRRTDASHADTAWLNELPRGRWVSSGRHMEGGLDGEGTLNRRLGRGRDQRGVAVSPISKK